MAQAARAVGSATVARRTGCAMSTDLSRSPDAGLDPARTTSGLDADLFFVGTATMLLRFGDLRILTDPNFIHAGEEIPLGYGLSTHRLTNPAMEIDALPDLDLVLLSHFHADHFDRVAEEKLDRELP